ncbi:MAG: hypothetical protein HY707_13780 [Ignavibacteriae bacterium]|nr:hypothetical protein [Ignavibacteriota bacterium]
MNKKLWVGFIAVFVVMVVTNFIIHEVLLGGTYRSESMASMMRPEMEAKLWIHFVTAAIVSFFFTLIFSKGYEGKGMGEGVRYGFYVGMLMSIPMAYDTYAAMPIPYSLALQWFIYGVIQYIILGVVVAMVYGGKPKASMPA